MSYYSLIQQTLIKYLPIVLSSMSLSLFSRPLWSNEGDITASGDKYKYVSHETMEK